MPSFRILQLFPILLILIEKSKQTVGDHASQNVEYAKSRESRRKCIVPSCKLRQENEEIQHWFLVPRCNIQTVLIRITAGFHDIKEADNQNCINLNFLFSESNGKVHCPHLTSRMSCPCMDLFARFTLTQPKTSYSGKMVRNLCFFVHKAAHNSPFYNECQTQ